MLKPFSVTFNIACDHIARKLFPLGFNVSEQAPATYDELIASFNSGRHTVWSGASDATIFGGTECAEYNWSFRAWHDWCHWRGQHDFTLQGEVCAARMQREHVRALYGNSRDADFFCKLIDEEVIAQAAYKAVTGAFPVDQRAFAARTLGLEC